MPTNLLKGPRSSKTQVFPCGLTSSCCKFNNIHFIIMLFQNSAGNLRKHRCALRSDWNVIMSVIFSYESHYRPVFLWITGIKCDEFIRTTLIQSVHLDGVLQSVSKEKHFHLH
uniref:Uncharacterized protein n=1 Tax=Coturnix japonica TaxID=93934 RepID=A0A8C2TVP8_COTJA